MFHVTHTGGEEEHTLTMDSQNLPESIAWKPCRMGLGSSGMYGSQSSSAFLRGFSSVYNNRTTIHSYKHGASPLCTTIHSYKHGAHVHRAHIHRVHIH